MSRKVLMAVIAIALCILPAWTGGLGAEVYYQGEWVKITDRVYHFQRQQSSNSGAIDDQTEEFPCGV